MDIKQQALQARERIGGEVDRRLDRLEKFIATRGIGSRQLSRARRAQRNVNLMVAAGCVITVTGIAVWALSAYGRDDA